MTPRLSRSKLALLLALLTQAVSGFIYLSEAQQPLTSALLGWSCLVLLYLWLCRDALERGRSERAPHPLAFIFFAPFAALDALSASRGWGKGLALTGAVALALLASFYAGAWLGWWLVPFD